jgi:hypothetical protein
MFIDVSKTGMGMDPSQYFGFIGMKSQYFGFIDIPSVQALSVELGDTVNKVKYSNGSEMHVKKVLIDNPLCYKVAQGEWDDLCIYEKIFVNDYAKCPALLSTVLGASLHKLVCCGQQHASTMREYNKHSWNKIDRWEWRYSEDVKEFINYPRLNI